MKKIEKLKPDFSLNDLKDKINDLIDNQIEKLEAVNNQCKTEPINPVSEKPFKVKIIKCSDGWWYDNKIGQEIFVKKTNDPDQYTDENHTWYLKQDCEIVDKIETNKSEEHLDKPFKVKIVKCSNPEWWYEEEIGKKFEVIDYSVEDYLIIGKLPYCISKQDCEIVKTNYCSNCLTENCEKAEKNSELLKGCVEKKYKEKMMICENADKCDKLSCPHRERHLEWIACFSSCDVNINNSKCIEVEEIPDWQKAVEEAENLFNNKDCGLYIDDDLCAYKKDYIQEIVGFYNKAISLMQTEIEKLKQQFTDGALHSAVTIFNLEAENKQLKKSELLFELENESFTIGENQELYKKYGVKGGNHIPETEQLCLVIRKLELKNEQLKSRRIKVDDDLYNYIEIKCNIDWLQEDTKNNYKKIFKIFKQIRGE